VRDNNRAMKMAMDFPHDKREDPTRFFARFAIHEKPHRTNFEGVLAPIFQNT
jgi:hypothetical protein